LVSAPKDGKLTARVASGSDPQALRTEKSYLGPNQMRVCDLARQLGVPAATVLEMARDLKLEIRNSLSSLTEEQCETISQGWQQLISVLPDPEEYRQSLLVADAERQVQASVPSEWLLAPTSVAWVEERQLQELRVLVPGLVAQGFD
jgi:hypothetical protein